MRPPARTISPLKLFAAAALFLAGLAAIIVAVVLLWPTALAMAGFGALYLATRIDIDRRELPQGESIESSREAL